MAFKFAKGGKPFPTRVVKDVGNDSTLKDSPGVEFGKGKKPKKSRLNRDDLTSDGLISRERF